MCCFVHRAINLDSGLGWSGACLGARDTILQELKLLISGLLLTRSGGLFWIYSFKLEGGACPLFCSEIEFSGRVVAGVLFCRV